MDGFNVSVMAYGATGSGKTYTMTGAGIAGGQIMAGTVGPAYGWRLPFVLSDVIRAVTEFIVRGCVRGRLAV